MQWLVQKAQAKKREECLPRILFDERSIYPPPPASLRNLVYNMTLLNGAILIPQRDYHILVSRVAFTGAIYLMPVPVQTSPPVLAILTDERLKCINSYHRPPSIVDNTYTDTWCKRRSLAGRFLAASFPRWTVF